jgi:hypothetical protein
MAEVTAAGYRSLAVVDADRDGVPNSRDACPRTTRDARVDALGCEGRQIDVDSDGVCDKTRPRLKATGAFAPTRWCTGADNCKYVANHNQRDVDGDGRGDACDLGTLRCAAQTACGGRSLLACAQCERLQADG